MNSCNKSSIEYDTIILSKLIKLIDGLFVWEKNGPPKKMVLRNGWSIVCLLNTSPQTFYNSKTSTPFYNFVRFNQWKQFCILISSNFYMNLFVYKNNITIFTKMLKYSSRSIISFYIKEKKNHLYVQNYNRFEMKNE